MILDHIKDIADSIIKVERSIGFRIFKKYVFLGLLVLAAINFKYIATETVIFVSSISNEIHNEKMNIRDEYMTEISPLLIELRIKSGADRVLYFEFHNSEENLNGIPFKFFDLLYANSEIGIPEVKESDYHNVNTGMYIDFFNDLKKKGSLVCHGADDIMFREKYLGLFSRMSMIDGCKSITFIGIPGVKNPIGFIALEWMDKNPNENYDREIVANINNLGIYYTTKCR